MDVILELHRLGGLPCDERRLVYERGPATGGFATLEDPLERRYRDNWEQVRLILTKRERAATHHELLADWPAERERPAASVLYEWLNRATEEGRVRRSGHGRRDDPYRYRLPNEDDKYYDRGELPPLKPLRPGW